MDYQGGKKHGQLLEEIEVKLDDTNKDLLEDDLYKDIEDLGEKLESFKEKFIQFDKDLDGVIGVMDLKRAMEDLGQPKTHLELMKMIREVDKEKKDAINYKEFIDMMLGAKTTVLKLVLLFESKAKKDEGQKKERPAKKSISDLP
ncbi:hypothetical protein LSH36_434g02046 [Paralvinella palmiformis]|uniref:EF-hand domain-containing protein n=1 Tax=Paralvinella palmiformis TaxID=53620 RepID=A0AAD9JB59_9ANNE|nr:hypothetical protein LSH36_434g02046 [Paralvinella palmiformis]